MLGMLPTLAQQECIVSGFIRKSSVYSIPVVLKKICLLFYDDIIHKKFKGKELNEFLSCSTGKTIYSAPFKSNANNYINNMNLYCCWCPNGWRLKDEGSLQYFIGFHGVDLPDNVSYISINYQLSCNQLNINWKSTKNFVYNKTPWFGWPRDTIKLKECINMKLNELDFNCSCVVLKIAYKNNKIAVYPKLPYIQMKQQSKYRWNFSSVLLEKFQRKSDDINRKLHCASPCIDKNWCLILKYSSRKKSRFLYIECLKLPLKVQSITVECKTIVTKEYNTGSHSTRNVCQTMKISYDRSRYQLYVYPDVETLTALSFSVDIQIEKAYDLEGNEIHCSKYSDYGIVCVRNSVNCN